MDGNLTYQVANFLKESDNSMSIEMKTSDQFTLLGNLLGDRLQELLEWGETDSAKVTFVRENPAEVAFAWTINRDAIVKHEEKEYGEARRTFVLAKQAIIENADEAQKNELHTAIRVDRDIALSEDAAASLWMQSSMSQSRWADEIFESMRKAAPDDLKSRYSDAHKERRRLEIEDGAARLGLSGFSCEPSRNYPRGATLSSSDSDTEEYAYVTLTLRTVDELQSNPAKLQKIKADLDLRQEDSNIAPARTDNGLPTGESAATVHRFPKLKA